MEMTPGIQEKLKSCLSGVYFGKCKLKGLEYDGVLSIGYNPYYDY